MLGGDHLFDHAAAAFVFLGFFECLFEIGDFAIGQFPGALELALALGNGQFVAGFIQFALEIGCMAQFGFFRSPGRGQP